MSTTVCLSPTATLDYPQGGGHLWVYLNWALGLRALGCEVVWLETISSDVPASEVQFNVATLKRHLERYGLAECLAVYSQTGEELPPDIIDGCLDLDAAAEADLLLNQRYTLSPEVVGRFRRSVLLDIDPGLLQAWISMGDISVAQHDMYFTIGETVGQPEARFPDLGLKWHYTPPPVFLPAWPPAQTESMAPFTTVSNWWGGEWVTFEGESYNNDKRITFLEYLDLPRRSSARLELALCLGDDDEEERRSLEERGWKIRRAWEVTSTPEQYHTYIQESRGEFSCVKPSCVRLNNAWISDRTLCYLASAKPAVVQHTGPSRFLPDSEGLFRFKNLEEAACALSAVESDYERHCRLARELAEEHFDAHKVVKSVLERALL